MKSASHMRNPRSSRSWSSISASRSPSKIAPTGILNYTPAKKQ
ncbi:MAG: hypothetical protein ABI401_02485 [Candidatus Dormibacter sp.]